MENMKEDFIDPAGIVDLSELNDISCVGALGPALVKPIIVATVVATAATIVGEFATNYFSCGTFCSD